MCILCAKAIILYGGKVITINSINELELVIYQP